MIRRILLSACALLIVGVLSAQTHTLDYLSKEGARIGRMFRNATKANDVDAQNAALTQIDEILATLKTQEQVDALTNAFNNTNVEITIPEQDAVAYVRALGNARIALDEIGIEDACQHTVDRNGCQVNRLDLGIEGAGDKVINTQQRTGKSAGSHRPQQALLLEGKGLQKANLTGKDVAQETGDQTIQNGLYYADDHHYAQVSHLTGHLLFHCRIHGVQQIITGENAAQNRYGQKGQNKQQRLFQFRHDLQSPFLHKSRYTYPDGYMRGSSADASWGCGRQRMLPSGWGK